MYEVFHSNERFWFHDFFLSFGVSKESAAVSSQSNHPTLHKLVFLGGSTFPNLESFAENTSTEIKSKNILKNQTLNHIL